MVDNPQESGRAHETPDPYDLVIADLRTRRDQHRARAAEELAEADKLDGVIQALAATHKSESFAVSAVVKPRDETDIDPTQKSLVGPAVEKNVQDGATLALEDWRTIPAAMLKSLCYGKGIAEAGMTVLTVVNHPMPENELFAALKAGGVIFVSSDPLNSFRNAMSRKQRETGAVVEAAPRMWSLSAWKEDTGFVQHRSRTEHMAVSLKGLQAAKERGVKLGAQPRITEEHAPEIAELLNRGTSMADLAEQFDMSVSGMIKAVMRLRDKGLVPGGPVKRRGRRGAPTAN